MARHFYPTVELTCRLCDGKLVANVSEADEAEGFKCPKCGEVDPAQNAQLMKALVALSDVVEGDGQFMVDAVRFGDEAPSSDENEAEDEREGDGEALRELEQLIAEGKGTRAFIAALQLRPAPRAVAVVAAARCRRCGKAPVEPKFAQSGAAYARFWRGHCPDCDVPLT